MAFGRPLLAQRTQTAHHLFQQGGKGGYNRPQFGIVPWHSGVLPDLRWLFPPVEWGRGFKGVGHLQAIVKSFYKMLQLGEVGWLKCNHVIRLNDRICFLIRATERKSVRPGQGGLVEVE